MSDIFPSAGQVDNLEHSDENHAKKVNSYSWNAVTGTWERNQVQPTLTARYDIQGSTIYVGEASLGAADADPLWTITKFDLTDLTAASGKIAQSVSWTTRASETYA